MYYRNRWAFPAEAGARRCHNCGGLYLPDANIGQWHCRVHREPMINGIHACCGIRVDWLNVSTTTAPRHYDASLDALQGCYVCDHDYSFATPTPERITLISFLAFRFLPRIKERAIVTVYTDLAQIEKYLVDTIERAEGQAIPVPIRQQVIQSWLQLRIEKIMGDDRFFTDTMNDDGSTREIFPNAIASAAWLQQMGTFVQMLLHVVKAAQKAGALTYRQQMLLTEFDVVNPDYWQDLYFPDIVNMWPMLKDLLGFSPMDVPAPQSRKVQELKKYILDHANDINLWKTYLVARLDATQDPTVVLQGRYQRYVLEHQ